MLAGVATLDATPVIVLDHRDDALDAADIDLLDALVRRLAPVPVVRLWGREPEAPTAEGAIVSTIVSAPADDSLALSERSGS